MLCWKEAYNGMLIEERFPVHGFLIYCFTSVICSKVESFDWSRQEGTAAFIEYGAQKQGRKWRPLPSARSVPMRNLSSVQPRSSRTAHAVL